MTLFAALAVPVRLAAQNNQDKKDARFIINGVGAIAGYYFDGSAAFHGFLRMPCGGGDHSDENCEDNSVGATGTTRRSPAPITQGMSTASPAQ
jgi:hypothetical protein